MLKQTKELKHYINLNFDDSYERVNHMKNCYEGETAYIICPGPSINSFSEGFLEEYLSDKLTLSIKQAYHKAPTSSDFLLLNHCNLDDWQDIDKDNVITGWIIWDANQGYELVNGNFPCDFILDTYKLGDGAYDMKNSITELKTWELMMFDNRLARPWGGGITYEIAIPLAVHLGCKKIVLIGMDLHATTLEKMNELGVDKIPTDHNYSDIKYKNTHMEVSRKEIESVISKGEFASDEIVNKLLKNTILNLKFRDRIIFDGYPRTVDQAKNLDLILKESNQKIDLIISLVVPREIIEKRIIGRVTCDKCNLTLNEFFNKEKINLHPCGKEFFVKRIDDNLETIMSRYDIYTKTTEPVLNFLLKNSNFQEIDGTLEIEEITAKIDTFINV